MARKGTKAPNQTTLGLRYNQQQRPQSVQQAVGTCRSWTPSVHISDFVDIFFCMPQKFQKKCGVVQTATTQSCFFPLQQNDSSFFCRTPKPGDRFNGRMVNLQASWLHDFCLTTFFAILKNPLGLKKKKNSWENPKSHLTIFREIFPYSKLAPVSVFGVRVFAALPGCRKRRISMFSPKGNPLVKLLEWFLKKNAFKI